MTEHTKQEKLLSRPYEMTGSLWDTVQYCSQPAVHTSFPLITDVFNVSPKSKSDSSSIWNDSFANNTERRHLEGRLKLENIILQMCTALEVDLYKTITSEHKEIEPISKNQNPLTLDEGRAIFDRHLIFAILKFTNKNISRSAELLGISRVSLYRLIDKYAINDFTYIPEQLPHDLPLRNVDLVAQNEHLKSIQTQQEDSNNYYADLFNNAPVGYLRLSDKGRISDINIAAAKCFGIDRLNLLSQNFESLVASLDSDRWSLFCAELKNHKQQRTIALSLKSCGDTEVSVRLDCLYINSTLRITLNDETTTNQVTTEALPAELLLTEGRQREIILNEELTRLQNIAESSPEVFFNYCFRPDGKVFFPYLSTAAYNKLRFYLAESSDQFSDLFDNAPADYLAHKDQSQMVESHFSPAELFSIDHQNLLSRRLANLSVFQEKMEMSKNEARTRLHGITKSLPEVAFEYSLQSDGRYYFSYVSDAALNILRFSPMELQNDTSKFLDLIHPDDYLGYDESLKQSARDLTPWNHEFRIKFDDDTVHTLLSNALPGPKADGSIFWYGFFTDITEQRQFKERMERKDISLNVISQGVFITDVAHKVTWANNAFELISGYHKTEILGLNYSFLNGPLTDCATISQIYLALTNLIPISCEILNYQKDATMFWSELTITPHFDEQGQIAYFINTIRDISESKQFEDKLSVSHAINIDIINSLSSCIAVLDTRGDIIMTNNSFDNLCRQYSLPETKMNLLGLNCVANCKYANENLCNEQENAAKNGIAEVLCGKKNEFNLEFECNSPPQTHLFRLKAMLTSKSPNFVIVSYDNITVRKQREQIDREIWINTLNQHTLVDE